MPVKSRDRPPGDGRGRVRPGRRISRSRQGGRAVEEAALTWRLIRAIVILPGSALAFLPGLILWRTAGTSYAGRIADPESVLFWLAAALAVLGLAMAVWTVRLFLTVGRGTPAPWDPPAALVVRGPYRHVRNPMIAAVLVVLLAEALFFRSWPIAVWLVLFLAGNAVYFPLHEEKRLAQRFGAAYADYKANVPRWWPRLTPWQPR